METVWLALGSNLGNRERNLRDAVRQLASPALRIQQISPVYETAPQGFTDQDWFLNLVLRAKTALTPSELLGYCESVEQTLGRERTIINGPRTIDVDILFFDQTVLSTGALQLPHPRYRERRFVLQPLADLNPALRDPVTGKTVESLLCGVADQAVRRTQIVIAPEPAP